MKKIKKALSAIIVIGLLAQISSTFAATMYAPDGRTLEVNDSEITLYESVGWFREPFVTMYAPDGRTLNVIQSEVEAYQNVGWFTTLDEANYNGAIPFFNAAMASADYNTAMTVCENLMGSGGIIAGTAFYEDLSAKRRQAADTWRNDIRCPIGVVSYTTDENSIGIARTHIRFRNLSYAPITAFKLVFYCYDAFGYPVRYYSYGSNSYDGYMDNIYIQPMDDAVYYWTLYGQEATTDIRNIHINEIVFADGTKWIG